MKFAFNRRQIKSTLTNIAICVAIFAAARYVVSPHIKHDVATGKPLSSATLTSNQETSAVRIANAYAQSHYQEDVSKLTPVVTNREGHIEVTYKLPENQIGGTPDIIIGNTTMTVIDAHRGQ